MSHPPEHPPHNQFLRLYAEHEVALHTFVRSMLPTREEASEVMQEVIVILWQKFSQVDDFRPWAFGVARLATLRHLERRKRDRHVFDSELVSQLADESAAMSERHSDQREALESCLQKLPATQRELVLTAYTKGTRMDDLATRRGQTPMSLYKLLHRIRQALLECVRRTLAKEETI
jgi:RNA polymerase sigma-70 factor (ECF subfamily)